MQILHAILQDESRLILLRRWLLQNQAFKVRNALRIFGLIITKADNPYLSCNTS